MSQALTDIVGHLTVGDPDEGRPGDAFAMASGDRGLLQCPAVQANAPCADPTGVPDMNRSATRATWWAWAACGLAGTLMLRLASLGRVPLTDNTESRYATIGWEMCRSGDWITPWVYSQGSLVPFWGKPPLQFWLTALSFRLGGVSETSARMPSYLLGTALLAGTMLFARALWGRRVALLAGLILATSGLFYLLSGACALDMPLTACVAAALMAFARFAAADGHRGRWGHAFFLALAAGALAKGPVALALTGLVILAWFVLVGGWCRLRALP